MDMPTFDQLRILASHDPAGFEEMRGKLIEDCINRSDQRNRKRLRGIQFVIDARRRVAGSPMKALMDIQAMMYDSFHDLRMALSGHQTSIESTMPDEARVLPFRRPSH